LLMFTPLNLIANEPNKTPLIPFEIVLPASKVRIQFISYSGPAATLARFWTGIMQADINL
jgi:hypothetical protein